jgi:hypothetical protein
MLGNIAKSMKQSITSRPETPTIDLAEEHLNKLLENLLAGEADFSPQDACPLFQIPGEIRNRIFEHVVTEHDGKDALSPTDYWYRPNFTHHTYVDTTLLRTCRRVWVETHHLPLEQTRRRFWAGMEDRAPTSKLSSLPSYMPQILMMSVEKMQPALRSVQALLKRKGAIESRDILPCEIIQVYIQMFALESGDEMKRILAEAEQVLAPRHIIITLRYTDWWYWEHNHPLRIESNWIDSLRLPATVEKITFELETRQGKQAQLDAIVRDKMSTWEFYTVEGTCLVPRSATPSATSHLGTNRPGGRLYAHHYHRFNPTPKGMDPPGTAQMYYYTVTMEFMCGQGSKEWKGWDEQFHSHVFA